MSYIPKSTFFTAQFLKDVLAVPSIYSVLNKDPSKPIHLVNKEFFQNAIINFKGDQKQLVKQLVSDIKNGCMREDPVTKTHYMDNVSETYVEDTINHVLSDGAGKFDIIVAIQGDKMVGLAIVNKGECGYYPDIFALQLICSGQNIVSGSVLLAMYLLALKHIGMAIGLLELAMSYENLGGLCAYDKFGFVESYAIKHEKVCFFGHIEDYDTLPMFVDVAAMTPEIIIDTLVNTPGKPKIARTEPLCNEFRKFIKSTRGINDPNELAIIEKLNQFVEDNQDKIAKKRIKGMNNIFGTNKKPQNLIYAQKVKLYKTNKNDPNLTIMNGQIKMLQDDNLLDTVKEIEKFKKSYIEYEAVLREPPRQPRKASTGVIDFVGNANKLKREAGKDPLQTQYINSKWVNTKKLKSECIPPLEWIPAKDSETGKGYCRQYQ